jgi:hypothetical protein
MITAFVEIFVVTVRLLLSPICAVVTPTFRSIYTPIMLQVRGPLTAAIDGR